MWNLQACRDISKFLRDRRRALALWKEIQCGQDSQGSLVGPAEKGTYLESLRGSEV